MKVQIVGVGVVGGSQAYLASQLGHQVLGVDHHLTSFEYATMSTNPRKEADLTFVCTPEKTVPGVVGRLVEEGVEGIVIKSTVPPGTTQILMEKHGVHICHNPEFLVEKRAYEDVTHPNVVVIGQCCAAHSSIIKDFYSPLGCPIIVTQPTTSEILKLAQNSYLAMLISFWNQVDMITTAAGVSTEEVARMARFNPRVSGYGTEFFGSPFGGKCLPKDLDQLIQFCQEVGADSSLLEAVKGFNSKLNANAV